MSESLHSSLKHNELNNKEKKSNSIKFGLLSQPKSCINVFDLINSYFKTSKINTYIIKDENHFEFTTHMLPELTVSINNLRKIDNLLNKYNLCNFFIIFIDIQNIKSLDFLENVINTIIDLSENNYNKKCYIFGFYGENNNKIIPKERITIIIDAKEIEYYYCCLKNNEIDKFSQLMEQIINDSNTLMVEKFLDQKHSQLIVDNSNSNCNIF